MSPQEKAIIEVALALATALKERGWRINTEGERDNSRLMAAIQRVSGLQRELVDVCRDDWVEALS